MKKKVHVTLQNSQLKSYPILLNASLFDLQTWLPQINGKKEFEKIVIVTDVTVQQLYGKQLQKKLKQANHQVLLIATPSGERAKSYKIKQYIENEMFARKCQRNTLLLALGGGVIGDVSGFVAATYLRGIPYVQLPTTLLAMVDSSVGGKVAINTPFGKNLIGAYAQPSTVAIDVRLLESLTQQQLLNGLFEASKMFLTHDANSFHYLVKHLDALLAKNSYYLQEIIARAVSIKAALIARDERDQGERQLLNFGHTIGHALEKLSKYRMPHGFAVAYGILVEATIAHLIGKLAREDLKTIQMFLASLGIQGKSLQKYSATDLIQMTQYDKKNRNGMVHYVLLEAIGKTYSSAGYTHPIKQHEVKQAFKMICGVQNAR